MQIPKINESKNPHETNLPKNNATKLRKLGKLLKPVKAFFKWLLPTRDLKIRNATINPDLLFFQERKRSQEPVGQPGLPSSRSIHPGVWNSSDNILQELQPTRR